MAQFRTEISEWPLQDKFAEVLRRTAPELPESMRHAFLALLSPASLALATGALFPAAASRATGMSDVVDTMLLVGASLCVGMAAFDAASGIGNFLVVTSSATNEKDLDAAARLLAGAIANVGIAALAAMVFRLAKSRGGGDSSELESELPNNAPSEIFRAIAKRRAANERLQRGPQFFKDMKKVGVTSTQIAAMRNKQMPLGFKSQVQFQLFKQELDAALKSDGLWDAEVGMKGTATTFYSENPRKGFGHHWDADPLNRGDRGDYDLNVTSIIMVEHMNAARIELDAECGIFRTRHLEQHYPALDKFAQKWSDELGRDVNFVGYPEPQLRDKTEFILMGAT